MDKFTKSIWITTKISAAGERGVSLKGLNERWCEEMDENPIPRKTFENYRRYIEDMFGINIDCIKSRNAYVIHDADEFYDNKLMMWLLHSFSMSATLSGDIRLRQRVGFEDVPGGTQYLDTIIEAMKSNFTITFLYKAAYWKDAETRSGAPFALRLFKQRWYLLLRKNDGKMRLYALDRMCEVAKTKEQFTLPVNFNLKDYFSECFGITKNESIETQEIVIKTDIDQANYLKNLPLHETQKIIEETDDYVIFSWKLKPTYDFIQQVLTMNIHAEVLKPESFRNEIKTLIMNMMQKY